MAPRARASRVLAIGCLLLSVGVAAFSGIANLLSSDVVAASEADAAGPASWLSRGGAWQWDAITALGLATALMGALIVSACFRARRRAAVRAAVGWAFAAAALSGLVWHASSNTAADLVLWLLLGAALLAGAVACIPAER